MGKNILLFLLINIAVLLYSERFVYDENGVLLKKDLYTFTDEQKKRKSTVYYEYNKTGQIVKETTEYYIWDSIYLMEFGDKYRTVVFYEY